MMGGKSEEVVLLNCISVMIDITPPPKKENDPGQSIASLATLAKP